MNFRSFLQPFCWTIALVVLYCMDRDTSARSLCLFRFAGVENCPGCGIGHAISEALHLNFSRSLHYHVMGIPAAFFLILFILRTFISSIKQSANGTKAAYDAAKSST